MAHTLLGVHDSASQTVTSSTAAPDATPVPGPTVAPDAATVSDPTAPATGSSIPALRSIVARIAGELGVGERQVAAAVALLDGGATVPFIARYRKEVTGGLDDAQLRTLEERLVYLRELDERRAAILESHREPGQAHRRAAGPADGGATPRRGWRTSTCRIKPKRRTKAQIAIEAGLEPLADSLLTDPTQDPATVAAGFINVDRGVADAAAALEGARAILPSGSRRTPTWSASCGNGCGSAAS